MLEIKCPYSDRNATEDVIVSCLKSTFDGAHLDHTHAYLLDSDIILCVMFLIATSLCVYFQTMNHQKFTVKEYIVASYLIVNFGHNAS